MFRNIALAFLLLTASSTARAVEEIVVTAHGPKKSPTISRVNPLIPRPADEVAKEGWVHLKLAISASGDVTDAKIAEAYPKGWFEDAVMKVVYGWKFNPRLENGVAVADPNYDVSVAFYADEYETGRNTAEPWERGGRVRGITPANMATFRRVAKSLDAGDLKVAGQNLDVLKTRFDANDLSVVEIARYFAFMTRFERMNRHFLASMAHARDALLLTQFFDNGKVVFALHLEVIANLTGLGRNDEAVDYFDSWNVAAKGTLPDALTTFMDGLRGEGAGKKRPYTIVDFNDTHVRRERRATGSGQNGGAQTGAGSTMGSSADAGGGVSGGGSSGGGGSGPQETRNHLQVAVQSICLDLLGVPVGNCS